jgi:hypothetical protein
VIDHAIDPADARRYVAATDTGIYESRSAGRGWSRVDRRRTGLLAYLGGHRLVLVRGDGMPPFDVEPGGVSSPTVSAAEYIGAPGPRRDPRLPRF